MIGRTLVLVATAVVVGVARTVVCSAQATTNPPSYQELVSQLRSGKLDIDYTGLRMAYAASDRYAPYERDNDLQRAMFTAFRSRDYGRAQLLADSTLKGNFTDFNAHYIAMLSATQQGDSTRASFHGRIARGLMESINSRSGTSPDSAMVVIDIAEEYGYMRVHGLEPLSQGLGNCAGKECDHIHVRERESGKEFDLYFDVSLLKAQFLKGMRNP